MPSTITQNAIVIQHLLSSTNSSEELGQNIIHSLNQDLKTLSPQYFYDEQGSILFEQICQLPEYYPTRTEASILRNHAHAIAQQTGPCELIELGSGSSTKTRYLLSAYEALEPALQYIPVDVSGEMLTKSAHQLLKEYQQLKIHGLVGTYEQALNCLPQAPKQPRFMIFLGSTLGNFSPTESDRFTTQIAQSLHPGDYFLLGVDLQKSPSILEAAYNDAQGVTAAFNLNMLSHLNWRFGSDFNTSNFTHRAIYNQELGQIEMYLDCKSSHIVTIEKLNYQVDIAANEAIRTEISRKFKIETLSTNLESQGLKLIQSWTDTQDWFALMLLQRS